MFRFRSHPESENEVRQVDRDELTYALFAAMRGWSVSVRRSLFGRTGEAELWRAIVGKQVSHSLRIYDFIDGSGEALGEDGRHELFARAIDGFPGAVGKLWLSPEQARQRDARLAASVLLYRALERYEVLTAGPYGATLGFPTITAPDYAFAPTWP